MIRLCVFKSLGEDQVVGLIFVEVEGAKIEPASGGFGQKISNCWHIIQLYCQLAMKMTVQPDEMKT